MYCCNHSINEPIFEESYRKKFSLFVIFTTIAIVSSAQRIEKVTRSPLFRMPSGTRNAFTLDSEIFQCNTKGSQISFYSFIMISRIIWGKIQIVKYCFSDIKIELVWHGEDLTITQTNICHVGDTCTLCTKAITWSSSSKSTCQAMGSISCRT